jgi:hypothetical protein
MLEPVGGPSGQESIGQSSNGTSRRKCKVDRALLAFRIAGMLAPVQPSAALDDVLDNRGGEHWRKAPASSVCDGRRKVRANPARLGVRSTGSPATRAPEPVFDGQVEFWRVGRLALGAQADVIWKVFVESLRQLSPESCDSAFLPVMTLKFWAHRDAATAAAAAAQTRAKTKKNKWRRERRARRAAFKKTPSPPRVVVPSDDVSCPPGERCADGVFYGDGGGGQGHGGSLSILLAAFTAAKRLLTQTSLEERPREPD